jgi:endonuclease/exonuclease/phosphatase family metal-dependent hydrolase
LKVQHNRGAKRLLRRFFVLCLIGLLAYAALQYQRARDSGRTTDATSRGSRPPAVPTAKPEAKTTPAPVSKPAELRVMTWNLEWFQDPRHGPADDARQYQSVKQILQESGMSLIGVVEIASQPDFERLLGELKGYSGLLSTYKSPQKVGLIYANTQFELTESRELTEVASAGRSPLEVSLRRRWDGLPLCVIVIHAKAMADLKSYRKRAAFAEELKAYLDRERAAVPLIILGDFNDLLSGSITAGMPSPYQNFVDDPAYFAATRVLNTEPKGENSGSWGKTIDHIMVSDELGPRVKKDSADVLQKELRARFTKYTRNVSDHYPVTLTLKF